MNWKLYFYQSLAKRNRARKIKGQSNCDAPLRPRSRLLLRGLFSLYFVLVTTFSPPLVVSGTDREIRTTDQTAALPRSSQEVQQLEQETDNTDKATGGTSNTAIPESSDDSQKDGIAELNTDPQEQQAQELQPVEESFGSDIADGSDMFDASNEPALQEIPISTSYRTAAGDNLTLVGTAVVDDSEKSMAIIADGKTGGQGFFREGDWIGGVRIKQILRNRVVVDDGGKAVKVAMLQSLPSKLPVSKSASETAAAQAAGGSSFEASPTFRLAGNRSSAAGRAGGRQNFVHLDRSAVDSYLADVYQAIQQMHVEPVTVFSRPAGIKLSPVPSDSIFAQMGLRNGDVIVGVNGESITRPEQAVRLLERIKEGGDVSIQVKGRRRNRIIQLDVG